MLCTLKNKIYTNINNNLPKIFNSNNEMYEFCNYVGIRIIDKNKIECWVSKSSKLIGIFYPNVSYILKNSKVKIPDEMINEMINLNIISRC